MYQASIFIQIFCAVLAAGILIHLLISGRKTKTTYSYMLCITLLFLWSLAEILVILSQNSRQEMIAIKLKFIPVVYTGASWFYFCLNMTQSKLAKSKFVKLFLVLFPAVCYTFLLTNEWHKLFFVEVLFKRKIHRGIIFWLHTAESYFLIIAGTAYLFVHMRRKVGKSLKYIMLLLLAVLIPMVANALMLIGVLPNKGLDITSQVLLLSFIFFGVAVYQQKFLNLYPVAARHFIETMPDGIIILDKENLVIGVNGAVNNLFPGLGLKIYDKSIKIIDYIRENDEEGFSPVLALALQDASTQLTEKVKLKIHDMVITVELMTLAGFHQTPTGKIVILENVTEEQQLLDEIQKKNLLLTKSNIRLTHSNNMLMSANNRLEKLSQTIEELAVMKERNRVGREVHDTVGHMLTLVIALAENAKLELSDEQTGIKETMDKSIELARQALNDIRNCLNGICKEPFEKASLVDLLNNLMKNNSTSGLKVAVSVSEDLPKFNAEILMTIYRICQESITNAIRHGNAKTVNIIIKNQQNSVRLYIFDDGVGCGSIVKGYGLTGMEDRVTKLGGKISFGSDGENGFNIIVDLPAC